MNKKQDTATLAGLLSEIATDISQTCSTRSSLISIYMGPSLSQTHLALFRPILLENYAFFCSLTDNAELQGSLLSEAAEIAVSLGLEAEGFLEARTKQYADSPDPSALYSELCRFVIQNKANSTKGKPVMEDIPDIFENNTQLAIQLGEKRLREAAGSF